MIRDVVLIYIYFVYLKKIKDSFSNHATFKLGVSKT